MAGQPLIENDQILNLDANKLDQGTIDDGRLAGGGIGSPPAFSIDISGTAGNALALDGTAAAAYALLSSPAFTGTPTCPTPDGSPIATPAQVVNAEFVEQFVNSRGFSDVAVGYGTVAHGGTIPLPSGYTQAQCGWTVGAGTWNQFGGFGRDGIDSFVVSVNASRVVSAYTTNGPTFLATSANYIIIGVK